MYRPQPWLTTMMRIPFVVAVASLLVTAFTAQLAEAYRVDFIDMAYVDSRGVHVVWFIP